MPVGIGIGVQTPIDSNCLDSVKLLLAGTSNKEMALVGAFPAYCENFAKFRCQLQSGATSWNDHIIGWRARLGCCVQAGLGLASRSLGGGTDGGTGLSRPGLCLAPSLDT